MTQVSFEQVRNAAAELYETNSGPLAREVSYMVDAARVNADDTVKDVESPEWHRIALDTLEMLCAYATIEQSEAVAWFIAHGVTF